MWKRHWKLARDPFAARDVPYVPTPAHAEAEARLVHAIEAGGALGRPCAAAPGLGKTLVLGRALERTRGPSRRIARVAGPVDGPSLLAELAEGLHARLPAGAAAPWPGNGWPTPSGSAARRGCTSSWPSTTAST